MSETTPKRVLYVEDDTNFLELVPQFFQLEAPELVLVTAASITQALDLIQNEIFACAILDGNITSINQDGYKQHEHTGDRVLPALRQYQPETIAVGFSNESSQSFKMPLDAFVDKANSLSLILTVLDLLGKSTR